LSHQNHPDSAEQDASVSKNPRVSSRDLHKALETVNMNVYTSQTLERECTNLEGQQKNKPQY